MPGPSKPDALPGTSGDRGNVVELDSTDLIDEVEDNRASIMMAAASAQNILMLTGTHGVISPPLMQPRARLPMADEIHPGAHPRAHARAHIGQRGVVVIPQGTATPRHAQGALPDWIPDGPGALEDYRALTSARHDAPRPGGTLAAPADPAEWSRHVTQRRVTELPDAFGP